MEQQQGTPTADQGPVLKLSRGLTDCFKTTIAANWALRSANYQYRNRKNGGLNVVPNKDQRILRCAAMPDVTQPDLISINAPEQMDRLIKIEGQAPLI